MKAIDVIREQVEQGVIYVEKNGEFWKIANKTNNPFKIIHIKPKRMEVRLKNWILRNSCMERWETVFDACTQSNVGTFR